MLDRTFDNQIERSIERLPDQTYLIKRLIEHLIERSIDGLIERSMESEREHENKSDKTFDFMILSFTVYVHKRAGKCQLPRTVLKGLKRRDCNISIFLLKKHSYQAETDER